MLMSGMLTITSELLPTANVDSRTRILYKSIHAGYHDMFAVLKFFHARAPGGPGAGSGIRSLLPGAPGPDLTISF